MHRADHEQGATTLQALMLQKRNLLMSEHNVSCEKAHHILASLLCHEWESTQLAQGSSPVPVQLASGTHF